ncbi:MAG: hypothetical protein KBC43_09935 [Bacteroidales bacterium]|nr:hypothetical protein [Bacteroidales bacterium]
MKMKILLMGILLLLILIVPKGVLSQWAVNGSHIYNTNAGNVGIGNNAPASLLYVGKSMTEPTITVRNLGGSGGATYSMVDDVSGANWKFKATNSGGFKIRDNAFGLDVFQIEANSAANVIYISAAGSLGVGTATPEVTAIADLSSTSRGFLPPRMTQTQVAAIPAPANGLLVFNTTDEKYYIYVELVNAWKEILYGSGTIGGAFTCGNSIIINHVASTVAPVDKTVTYGTVTNVPGETSKCWITQNLGADHEADFATDNTEPSAGWYWQYNRMQGFKHDGTTRTPNTTWLTPISENAEWQLANDPCALLLGNEWRLPTYNEWYNVDVSGGWNGYNATYSSLLKLHVSGYLANSSGALQYRGSMTGFWSSSQVDNGFGWGMFIWQMDCYMNSFNKAFGYNARCIK